MTLLTRIEKTDPFEEMTNLRNRMDRLFARFGEEMEQPIYAGSWMPTTDIFETKDQFIFKSEVPGLEEKDIAVELDNNVLTIKGERKLEEKVEEKGYQRIERAYGKFVRTFSLPPTVDRENITASYVNGVLELRIPKKEQAKAKKIMLEIKPGKAASKA